MKIARVPRLIQQDVVNLVDNQDEKPQIVVSEPFDGLCLFTAGRRKCCQKRAMVLV